MPSEMINFPGFLTSGWVASNLRITDAEAKQIGEAFAKNDQESSWASVTNRKTFATVYLEAYSLDPGIGVDCRKALGKQVPPLFTLPSDPAVSSPKAGASAKKSFGHFAACGRARAEDGDHAKASEYVMLELLEYGGVAEHAIELTREIQILPKYAELVACARTIEQRSFALALVEQGLEEAEAQAEAGADIAQGYAMAKMNMEIEEAVAVKSEEYLDSLRSSSTSLGNASAMILAYLRIASAPLSLTNALEKLNNAVSVILEHLEGSEDTDLESKATEARTAVSACNDYLVERDAGCEVRLMADDVQRQAEAVAVAATEAVGIKVKSLKDAKKMEKAFVKANTLAKDACDAATKCAKFINTLPKAQSNEEALEAAASSIQDAFSAGRKRSLLPPLKRSGSR